MTKTIECYVKKQVPKIFHKGHFTKWLSSKFLSILSLEWPNINFYDSAVHDKLLKNLQSYLICSNEYKRVLKLTYKFKTGSFQIFTGWNGNNSFEMHTCRLFYGMRKVYLACLSKMLRNKMKKFVA